MCQADVCGLHEFDFFVQGDGKSDEHIRDEHPIQNLRSSTVDQTWSSIEEHVPEEDRTRVAEAEAEAAHHVAEVEAAGDGATEEMKHRASAALDGVLVLKRQATGLVTGVGHGVLHATETVGLALIGSYDGNEEGEQAAESTPKYPLEARPSLASPRESDLVAEAHLKLAILCARCLQHNQEHRCTMKAATQSLHAWPCAS